MKKYDPNQNPIDKSLKKLHIEWKLDFLLHYTYIMGIIYMYSST